MTRSNRVFRSTAYLRAGVFVWMAFACPFTQAATIWTGPNINWTKSASTPGDTVLAGKVVLTRGNRDVLYNIAAGEKAAGADSPKDTMWAFGNIADAATLSYQTLESLRKTGNVAAAILNKPMVVHLVAEDIYFSIKFTTWGQHSVGTVAYMRSTPAAAVPPAVSITSPAAGTTFTAPASLTLTASATVGGGTVTNVEYFAGATSLGHATVTPFSVNGNISTPGAYALTAVATANGVSATSAVVNITVSEPASPPNVTITGPSEGAVFTAPADVTITVNVSSSRGSPATNVSFFNGSTLLGSSQAAPFTFIATNLAAGNYPLSAVATASGISGTSEVVHISVNAPVTTSITAPGVTNGIFSFNYTATPGLTYVVEMASSVNSSSTLNWAPIVTNVASSDLIPFSEPRSSDLFRLYRIARLPSQ